MTKSSRQQHIEAIKNKGTINAFDCIFYPSPKAKNQEQLTSAQDPAQVSQTQNQKPARRKRHSAGQVSNE